MMDDSKKLRHEGPWGLGVGVEGGDLSLSLVSMLQGYDNGRQLVF